MAKLLRDEQEVKLNDLLRAFRKAAEHYRAAAEELKDDAVAAHFDHLAQSRREAGRSLEQFIRMCNYLPEAPDPDRRTVENLSQRARIILSKDEQKTISELSARLEGDIQACLESLLQQAWPAQRRRELHRLARAFGAVLKQSAQL